MAADGATRREAQGRVMEPPAQPPQQPQQPLQQQQQQQQQQRLPMLPRQVPPVLVQFLAGGAYGFTSVLVGQPMETVKTRMQSMSGRSSIGEARALLASEGIRGLYRGGTPMFLGGTLFRSAQFGVYNAAMVKLRVLNGGPTEQRIFGFVDPMVVVAGLLGGVGRGLVEGPFDYIKVRQQVNQPWRVVELTKGLTVTLTRNSLLFCCFASYMDWSRLLFPDGQLGPFLTGALCSNLAWLTIWPLDVVKSKRQSGLFESRSTFSLLTEVVRTGTLYRGVMPGLARSFLANGASMTVFAHVESVLGRHNASFQ